MYSRYEDMDRYSSHVRFEKQVRITQSLAFRIRLQMGDLSYDRVMNYLDNYADPTVHPPKDITKERFAAMVVQSPNINLFQGE